MKKKFIIATVVISAITVIVTGCGLKDDTNKTESTNALNLYITDYTQNPDDFTAYRLGKMYFNGLGTDIDINKAIHWFSQAEKLGNTNSAYQLGKIAFENNDIENAIVI